MKSQHFFYFIAIFAILFTACKKEISISGIALSANELTLAPGDIEILIATIHPADATNKTVIWTSSNPAVAIVTENGLVTAVANGKATITVTTQDGKKTAICPVNVDYRSQWIGDWDFKIACSCPIIIDQDELPHPIYEWISVYSNYSGWLALSSYPQKIVVHWGNDTTKSHDINNGEPLWIFNQTNEFTVSSSGELSYPEYGGFGHNHLYYGSIVADTIKFNIGNGGLGLYAAWNVIGIKKSNKIVKNRKY